MKAWPKRLLASCAVAAVFASGAAAQDVDTRLEERDDVGFTGYTIPITAFGFGQTFTASGSTLDDFSFWLTGYPYQFQPFVLSWDGTQPGATIWAGDIFQALGPGDEYNFSVGSALDPGATYLAVLILHRGGTPGNDTRTDLFLDSYDGGNLVRYELAPDFNHLTPDEERGSTLWSAYQWQSDGGYDAAFSANFSTPPTNVVPEPITMVLMGSGLVGVAGAARRRRRGEADLEAEA